MLPPLPDDPNHRCGFVTGSERCVLRPHDKGAHVFLLPMDPRTRVGPGAKGCPPCAIEIAPTDLDPEVDLAVAPRARALGPDEGPLRGVRVDHPVRAAPVRAAAASLARDRAYSDISYEVRDRAAARPAAPRFTGDMCEQCGSMEMVRSGSCATCQNCGSTSGCS